MAKYDARINLLVTLMVIDTFVIGYSIGRIYPPNQLRVTDKAVQTASNVTAPKEASKVNNEPKTGIADQTDTQPKAQEAVKEENQKEIISEKKAIELVDNIYQKDGHTVIMSQNDNTYEIGCFMEMRFDEETNEPRYNMQTAEYLVDKHTGKVTTIKDDSKPANNTQPPVEDIVKIYTRDEVNQMIEIPNESGLYSESELGDFVDDKILYGENCYPGNVVWQNGNRSRMFWIGSETLNVYNEGDEMVGTVEDNLASILE